MKLVTHKPQQEIAIEDCTNSYVYILADAFGYYLLTAVEYESSVYKWLKLDNTATRGNGRTSQHAFETMLDDYAPIYQFDTMREAMLFVFGEKEVGNG